MSKLINILFTSCLLLFTIHCSLFTVHAQSNTAQLSGTVVDQNGAVVPGVKVSIMNPATGMVRSVTTDESGAYTIPLLPPATYTVMAEATGFKRVQLQNVVLNVGDQKSLKVDLSIGDVAGVVEVVADAPTLRTDGSVGTVINRDQVENMPLSGRSFQSLLELTPGVVIAPASQTQQGQFSVNGQRTNANYFTVDGVSANAGINGNQGSQSGQSGSGQLPSLTASGSTASLATVDALQEFRIQTSSYAPEFGRQPGGQVSLVTRSGGNRYHGSLFEYLRNEVFDANNWFNNANRLAKPPTRQNQFGGTFSGPLPFLNFGDENGSWFHSGKDRTFFFFSYEGLRLLLPKSGNTTVLSVATRNNAPAAYQPYVHLFPIPNGQIFTNGTAQFTASYADPSRHDATALRVDHRAGPVNLFGRYTNTPSFSKTRSGALATRSFVTQNNETITGGATWLINKKVINDLRVNHTTMEAQGGLEADGFGGAVSPEVSINPVGLPRLLVAFLSPTGGTVESGTVRDAMQRQLNIVENLIVATGGHALKFGADFRRINPRTFGDTPGNISLFFTLDNITPGSPTVGRVFQYSMLVNLTGMRSVVFDNLSLYAQDTWRVNSRLTLTYGVRWELVPPPHASEGPEALTFEGLDDPRVPGAFRFAPIGTPLWETRYNNFAPRFGASYMLFDRPGRELVVRGGVGMFYDLGLGFSSSLYEGVGYPNTASRSVSNAPFPLTGADLVVPTAASPPGVISAMDRQIRLPKTYQWNLAAEQAFGSKHSVSVSYVASEGRDLLKNDFYAASAQVRLAEFPNSNVTLSINRNRGYSDYRALQVQMRSRFAKSFQGLFNYTLSRSRDTSSSDGDNTTADTIVPIEYDYGYSSFDVRHNFTASVSYETPKFKGWKNILSNWGLDAIVRARTGFPVNVFTLAQVPGLLGNNNIRANVIAGEPFWIDDPKAPGGRRLNNRAYTVADNPMLSAAGCRWVARPTGDTTTPIGNAFGAFCTPAVGTLGNLPRGAVRGFPARQLDIGLRREFGLVEKLRMQLRMDAFNVFNLANFGGPGGSRTILSSSTATNFGLATQTLNNQLGGLSALHQVGGPRSMQFSVRFLF